MRKGKLNISSVVLALSIVSGLFMFSGCEEDFESREENTSYYHSIYGYLDATLDEQWMRIVPVRETFDPTTAPINLDVTIRNLDTGERTQMEDSLFAPNELAIYWNFSTTLPIRFEDTYEIEVENEEGIQSRVRVTIPPDYETPKFVHEDNGDYLYVSDQVRIVDLQTIWLLHIPFRNRYQLFQISHLSDSVISYQPNLKRFEIDEDDDFSLIERRMNGIEFEVVDRQIYIAGGGPDWVDLYKLDENIYTLPEGISNVENGVGYAFGVVSKTVPWQSCIENINGIDQVVGCELETRIVDPDL